jgi:hypothetical protein
VVAIAVAVGYAVQHFRPGRRLGVGQVLVEDAGSQRAAGRCARRRLLHGRHGGSLKQREALGWKHKPRRARSCVGCRCDEALAFAASHQY